MFLNKELDEQTVRFWKMSKVSVSAQKYHSPMFFPIADGKLLRPTLLNFSNDKKVALALESIRILLAEMPKIEGFMLIIESWYLTVKKDMKDMKKKGFPKPSASPDRKECLILAIIMRNGSKKMIMTPFKRTESEEIAFEKEIIIMNNDVQGEFATLFEKGQK